MNAEDHISIVRYYNIKMFNFFTNPVTVAQSATFPKQNYILIFSSFSSCHYYMKRKLVYSITNQKKKSTLSLEYSNLTTCNDSFKENYTVASKGCSTQSLTELTKNMEKYMHFLLQTV